MPKWLSRVSPFSLIGLALGLSLMVIGLVGNFSVQPGKVASLAPSRPPAREPAKPSVEPAAPAEPVGPVEPAAQPAAPNRVAALVWSSTVRTVVAPRAGQVVALLGREGQDVAARALLARLDDRDAKVALRQTENRLSVARIEARRLEAMHQLVAADLKRYQELQAAGLSSRQDVDRKELEVFQAAMAAEKAMVEISNLSVEVERLRDDVERCAITSPVAGRVLRCLVKETEQVGPGGKICEIADPRRLEIRFRLPRASRRFKLGDRVAVCAPGDAAPVAYGIIRAMESPLLLPNTDEIEYIAILESTRSLAIGMAVEVIW